MRVCLFCLQGCALASLQAGRLQPRLLQKIELM